MSAIVEKDGVQYVKEPTGATDPNGRRAYRYRLPSADELAKLRPIDLNMGFSERPQAAGIGGPNPTYRGQPIETISEEPIVSPDERFLYEIAANPANVAKWFRESRNMEVKEVPGPDGKIQAHLTRRPGERDWHVINPSGFDTGDFLGFLGKYAIPGAFMAMGEYAGSRGGMALGALATPGLPVGPILGAAGGGMAGVTFGAAGAEALRENVMARAGISGEGGGVGQELIRGPGYYAAGKVAGETLLATGRFSKWLYGKGKELLEIAASKIAGIEDRAFNTAELAWRQRVQDLAGVTEPMPTARRGGIGLERNINTALGRNPSGKNIIRFWPEQMDNDQIVQQAVAAKTPVDLSDFEAGLRRYVAKATGREEAETVSKRVASKTATLAQTEADSFTETTARRGPGPRPTTYSTMEKGQKRSATGAAVRTAATQRTTFRPEMMPDEEVLAETIAEPKMAENADALLKRLRQLIGPDADWSAVPAEQAVSLYKTMDWLGRKLGVFTRRTGQDPGWARAVQRSYFSARNSVFDSLGPQYARNAETIHQRLNAIHGIQEASGMLDDNPVVRQAKMEGFVGSLFGKGTESYIEWLQWIERDTGVPILGELRRVATAQQIGSAAVGGRTVQGALTNYPKITATGQWLGPSLIGISGGAGGTLGYLTGGIPGATAGATLGRAVPFSPRNLKRAARGYKQAGDWRKNVGVTEAVEGAASAVAKTGGMTGGAAVVRTDAERRKKRIMNVGGW